MGENIPNIFSYPWPYNVLWISDNPQPHIAHFHFKQGTGQCWLKQSPVLWHQSAPSPCDLPCVTTSDGHATKGSTRGFPLCPGWAGVKARLNPHHFVNPTPEVASSPPLPPSLVSCTPVPSGLWKTMFNVQILHRSLNNGANNLPNLSSVFKIVSLVNNCSWNIYLKPELFKRR